MNLHTSSLDTHLTKMKLPVLLIFALLAVSLSVVKTQECNGQRDGATCSCIPHTDGICIEEKCRCTTKDIRKRAMYFPRARCYSQWDCGSMCSCKYSRCCCPWHNC